MPAPKRTLTEKQKKFIAAGGIVVFIAATVLVFIFVGRPMVEFLSEPEQFRAWVDSSGFWGRLAFVGMMVLQIFIAFIPGEPLEISAGYAFGFWEGTLLCLIGSVIGAALVFQFVRSFGIKALEVFFPREKIVRLKFLRDRKKRNILMVSLFLIPGTPKDILTYTAGLTDISLLQFLLLTTPARIPSIITSTIGGNALGLGNIQFAVIVFAATLLICIAGILIYRRISRT